MDEGIRDHGAHEPLAPVLYHGTSPENAARLLRDGWRPNETARGGNMGQRRYLYLSTGREDALWFAREKGFDAVVELRGVPLSHLIVDPEDGCRDTLEEELAEPLGLPGKVALTRPLPAEHFAPSPEPAPGGPRR